VSFQSCCIHAVVLAIVSAIFRPLYKCQLMTIMMMMMNEIGDERVNVCLYAD